MSERLPRVNASEVIKVLEKAGYSFSCQSSSHKIYKNRLGESAEVPSHSGTILHPKVVKSILRDTDLSVDKFIGVIEYYRAVLRLQKYLSIFR